MEGINIWSLIILLVILMLFFGTKKIRNIGSDLGHSIKSFKDALTGKGPNTQEKQEATNESKEIK